MHSLKGRPLSLRDRRSLPALAPQPPQMSFVPPPTHVLHPSYSHPLLKQWGSDCAVRPEHLQFPIFVTDEILDSPAPTDNTATAKAAAKTVANTCAGIAASEVYTAVVGADEGDSPGKTEIKSLPGTSLAQET